MVIVVACFAIAMYMITSSYKEWQESPVSTTITTHPITELDFPTVTVCPPRGSNTALNHLLEKVNEVLAVKLTREDVEGVFAGLRPLLAGESDETSELSREHIVAHTVPGLSTSVSTRPGRSGVPR